jgi:hypothetical protein
VHARVYDGVYADDSNGHNVQSLIHSAFMLENRAPFLDWLETRHTYLPSITDSALTAQPLYYASLLGFIRSVMLFWEDSSQLEKEDCWYGNALNAAACMGHVEVVA